MKTYLLFFVVLVAVSFSCSTDNHLKLSKPVVLVTSSPYHSFVSRIAQDTVSVLTLVPPQANLHTYEPKAKQILDAQKSIIWFQTGEPIEKRFLSSIEKADINRANVDLRNGVALMSVDPHSSCCHHHVHDSVAMDLHVWLSPKMVKKQIQTIGLALIKEFPEHESLYRKNLNSLVREVEALDKEITAILKDAKNKSIVVSHPAYSYFCRDYHLKQIPLEFEGKDLTVKQLTKTLNEIKARDIKILYGQKQLSNRGAHQIAKSLGLEVIVLDPFDEDYLVNMKKIALAFAKESF